MSYDVSTLFLIVIYTKEFAMLSQFDYTAMTNRTTKSNLGCQGFFWLTTSTSQSVTEGNQGRSLEPGTKAETTEEC